MGSEICVVLVEIRKGRVRLTRTESPIRNAVDERRVSWKIITIPDDDTPIGPFAGMP